MLLLAVVLLGPTAAHASTGSQTTALLSAGTLGCLLAQYGRTHEARDAHLIQEAGGTVHVDQTWARLALASDVAMVAVPSALPDLFGADTSPRAVLLALAIGLPLLTGRDYAHRRATRPRPPRQPQHVPPQAAAPALGP